MGCFVVWPSSSKVNELTMESGIICGDACEQLKKIASAEAALVVTSPPYFQHRDYGVAGQIGREHSVDLYLERLGEVLTELRRVTRDDGTCFFVVGDTYRKGRLLLIPHQIALLATTVGWIVRNDIIWQKPDPPPESPRNRWRASHEHVLFFAKRSSGYCFNADAIRVPYSPETIRRWGAGQEYGGPKTKKRRNFQDSRMRAGRSFSLNSKGCLPTDVWTIPSAKSSIAHFAAFPVELVMQIISACTRHGDLVLDPFAGTGTTCAAAVSLGRRTIGIELNPEYAAAADGALMRALSRER